MNQQNLLRKVLPRGERNIAAVGFDVAHQFCKRPVVLNVPDEIRQENQESRSATQPNPFVEEKAPLWSQQQPSYDCEPKHGDGVLLFRAYAGHDSKPKPITGIVAFDGENGKV